MSSSIFNFKLDAEDLKNFAKNKDTENNIVEKKASKKKVKVVKPKKNPYLDTLRSDPKNAGFTLALDIINRKRKER